MEYLVKDEDLELKYIPGKGAWTYHIQVPNSQSIPGKWGTVKVSGFIDNHPIEAANLAPIKDGDKILSINSSIRKSINKNAGDTVRVTLYLLKQELFISEKDLIEIFNNSEVSASYNRLNEQEKSQILKDINSKKSEEDQIKFINRLIEQMKK